MGFASANLQLSCTFPLTASPTTSRVQAHSLSFLSCSAAVPNFYPQSKPRTLSLRRISSITAVVGDATAERTAIEDDNNVVRNGEERDEKDDKMVKVCDKLIGIFMVDKPNAGDWRKLLAFSREWENIRPHFFKHCEQRAETEDDPGMKHRLLRLARKLKEIDEDVQRHNELIEAISNEPELSEVVSRRPKDFTKEFFVHLYTVPQSYHYNPDEQNAQAKLGNDCVAAIQAYDSAKESMEALNAAEFKLQVIINSSSLDAACRKIDDLADKNQLDLTLVLMVTKAWSAAKESNMTKDEVKDILFYLYKTALGNLQRNMPKDIRIVKYLLTIAFTPGEELEGMWTPCARLLNSCTPG